MTAAEIARRLQGRRSGNGFMARCPAHDDRNPSLSIRDGDDGKILIHCHAGCEQERVIATLHACGLWKSISPLRFHRPAPRPIVQRQPDRDYANRSEAALAIWRAAWPSSGTPVETYLAARGLHLPPPATLRFHPRLKHPSGGLWPTMIALVTGGADDKPLAIHRTFLARDGGGKALVDPQKMMFGPCRGGAVRLAEIKPGLPLVIGEGIETSAAVMVATGFPAWAAMSAPGLVALKLPPEAEAPDIIIAADNDSNGVGQRAACEAAQRFLSEGRQVRIATPPLDCDFNDVLMGRAAAPIEETCNVAA